MTTNPSSRYQEVRRITDVNSQNGISNSKLCLLFTVLCVLGLLCLANLLILSLMYYVLEIQDQGMKTISFSKESQHLRWILDTDFETIVLPHGVLSGFSDKDIEIIGNNQNLTLSAEFASLLRISPEGTFMKANNFKFVNPTTKKSILDFDSTEEISVIGDFGDQMLRANAIKTPRIVSPLNKDLTFKAHTGSIELIGNEGVLADAKQVTVTADQDIHFKVDQTVNTMIFHGGNGGIRLNNSRLINTKTLTSVVQDAERYRLCICLKTGMLFRSKVQDKVTCAVAKENPCP